MKELLKRIKDYFKQYYVIYYSSSGWRRGFQVRFFPTRWLAEKYVKLFKVYGATIKKTDARSEEEMITVKFDPRTVPDRYEPKRKGVLSTHFETGMEQLGLIFKENNKDGYDGLYFIRHFDIILIESVSEPALAYLVGESIVMMPDYDFAKDNGYGLSFYCTGFTLREWVLLFSSETKVTYFKAKKMKRGK